MVTMKEMFTELVEESRPNVEQIYAEISAAIDAGQLPPESFMIAADVFRQIGDQYYQSADRLEGKPHVPRFPD